MNNDIISSRVLISTTDSVFESAAIVEIQDKYFHDSKEERDGPTSARSECWAFDFVQTDIMYCTRPTELPDTVHVLVLDNPSPSRLALLYIKCLFAPSPRDPSHKLDVIYTHHHLVQVPTGKKKVSLTMRHHLPASTQLLSVEAAWDICPERAGPSRSTLAQ